MSRIDIGVIKDVFNVDTFIILGFEWTTSSHYLEKKNNEGNKEEAI